MLEKLFNPYKNLSKEIWILALLTLINRAGAMVIPFLSLYLTKSLGFSKPQIAWIMTSYGIGSVVGTWLGGKLTDKIGYQKLMYMSLLLTAFSFIGLQYLSTFWELIIGISVLSLIADMFRPAIWVAIDNFSTEENKTRSVTLIRLAINLGFSVGPAIGGFIIANMSYSGLFWVDGITTFIAAIIIFYFIKQKSNSKMEDSFKEVSKLSPYRDKQYLIFWLAMFLCGFAFVQFIFSLPLFYDEVVAMTEQKIGYLLALNGLIIFFTEMPIVSYFVKKKTIHFNLMIYGTLLMAISFLLLNINQAILFVVFGMIFLTFGELLSFPFSNTYAMERAKKGNKGEYMALYTISFSVANIIGPNIGLNVIEIFGYNALWYVSGISLLLSVLLFIWLKRDYLKDKMMI